MPYDHNKNVMGAKGCSNLYKPYSNIINIIHSNNTTRLHIITLTGITSDEINSSLSEHTFCEYKKAVVLMLNFIMIKNCNASLFCSD